MRHAAYESGKLPLDEAEKQQLSSSVTKRTSWATTAQL